MAGSCEQEFWKLISSFHREADENCALLGPYAGRSGNFLPKFRDNLSVFGFLALEEWTYMLYPNVGKELPLLAA